MLFDLRSPGRRRVIKVIYGGLAALLAIGLVGFGIGSDASGGLSEVFGGGGDEGTGFEDDISEQESKLETNPQDTVALAELIRLRYQSGTQQYSIDEETGQTSFTPEAEAELQKAADAWDAYVKASGAKASPNVALFAVQAHSALATGLIQQAATGSGQQALSDADDALASWKVAAEAQRIESAKNASADNLAQIAYFLYFSGDTAGGDQASQEALAAADPDEKGDLQKQLDQISKQGAQLNEEIDSFRKQLAKASAGAGAGGATGGENPISGGGALGGGGLGGGALSTP